MIFSLELNPHSGAKRREVETLREGFGGSIKHLDVID